MDILINGLLLGGSVCWILGGMFALYTSVRDDIRNELERKAKQNKEKLSQTPLSRKNK